MKILIVIPYFAPAWGFGGPVKVSYDLSRELIIQGHKVTVITTDVFSYKQRVSVLKENINGIDIIRFKNFSNYIAKWLNIFSPIGLNKWVKNNIKQFDIIICHDIYNYFNIVIKHYCLINQIPYIIHPHGVLSSVSQKSRFFLMKKLFLYCFKKFLLNADSIIALTVFEKQSIQSVDLRLKNIIHIIPNGIYCKDYLNIKKISLSKKYGFSDKTKIIAFLGRIQFIKGIDYILKVLPKIKTNHKVIFLIIGPDEGEKIKLIAQAKNLQIDKKILFVGQLNGKEKLETIKSCDLFLLLSRSEGLPISVLEIAALGIPQIVSKQCNMPEIEKYHAGYIVNKNNSFLIAQKIAMILSDKNEWHTLSTNAKIMCKEKFSFDNIVSTYEKMLSKIYHEKFN